MKCAEDLAYIKPDSVVESPVYVWSVTGSLLFGSSLRRVQGLQQLPLPSQDPTWVVLVGFWLHGCFIWWIIMSSGIDLTTCQKKAIHIIHNKPYNYHTSQLFKQSNILKFNDLYKYEVCRHIHDSIGGRLPKPLLKVYSPNSTIHSYNTRQRNYPHTASRIIIIIIPLETHLKEH